MAPAAAQVDWPLLCPEGIADGMAGRSARCCTIATFKVDGASPLADFCSQQQGGSKYIEFWFQQEEGILVLHTSHLEKYDPWRTHPIKLLPEVICTDYQLVLLRLCGNGSNSPTFFFVYSFPVSKTDTAKVVMLPDVVPEISLSQSFGLLRDKKKFEEYVVAILQIKFNHSLERMEACLYRCWGPFSPCPLMTSKNVTLPPEVNMCRWQTDQVIPYHGYKGDKGSLLWVCLKQGILFCSNPLDRSDPNFNFIDRPKVLPQKMQCRPDTLMCVGCCHGTLKFVNLNIRDGNTLEITINSWDNKAKAWKPLHSSKKYYLNCAKLWFDLKKMTLPQGTDTSQQSWAASDNHMPCFPVLSTEDHNILYLTIVKKDKKCAWRVQVQVNEGSKDGTLVGAADCLRFCGHQKPPYPAFQDSICYRELETASD